MPAPQFEDYENRSDSRRDVLTVLFKHKTSILIIFLTTLITSILGSFQVRPVYEANSSLLVKFGREYINRSEVGDLRPSVSLNQDETINSEIQILMNRDLIEKVITSLKIENLYPDLLKNFSSNHKPLEAAILAFEKNLKVEGVKKSNVIKITFRHNNPQMAAKAVNLLVDLYKEKHLQVFSDPQSSFLEKQLVTYEEKLKNSENKMQAYKQKNRVFSLDEQRSLLLKQRTDLDTALKNSQNYIEELQKKLATLKSQMKTISANAGNYTSTERDKIIVEAKAKLLAMQIEEQELLRKYKEDNRLVINIRNEIQLVKDYLKEQEEDIKRRVKTGNAVYQGVEVDLNKTEADLNAQKAKAATLQRQLNQVDREVQSLDMRDKDFQNLKREQAINEKNHRVYAERTEEGRISEDMNRHKLANISVIQAAAVPIKPVNPGKRLYLALGLLLGAGAGLAFAFLSEHVSDSISTPEKAEKRLGLPVLATIAHKEREGNVHNFYNLEQEPFRITPDPAFLYLSPTHKEALASIIYGVKQRKGFVAISGEVGVGKTTILRSFLETAYKENIKVIYIFNVDVSFNSLLKRIIQGLGCSIDNDEVNEMLTQLYHILIQEYKNGGNVVIIIDEAQNMPLKTLEQLRMISNLETSTDKLIQVVFSGQPEFDVMLDRYELRQLKQRIAIKATIRPLTSKEGVAYIKHRLAKVSSGDNAVFSERTLQRIVRVAKGIPRTINIVCDNCLVTSYGYRHKTVKSAVLNEICVDLGLAKPVYAELRFGLPVLFLVGACCLWLYASASRLVAGGSSASVERSAESVVQAGARNLTGPVSSPLVSLKEKPVEEMKAKPRVRK